MSISVAQYGITAAAERNLTSFGYEGLTQSDLVAALIDSDVEVLVDVRLNPISRKTGLSKTALSEALAASGIEYVHLRALGNPKENRAGFVAGERGARERYRQLLRTGAGRDGVEHIRALVAERRVALLCFEREFERCHRSLVADEVAASD